MTPDESLQTPLPDTLKTASTIQPNVAKLDLLPRGSELILRTIKRLAMEAEGCDSLEAVLDKVKTINAEVTTLLARCEKRKGADAAPAA